MEIASKVALYEMLVRRDATLDALVFVAVKSTGIYCRLSCPAAKPLFRNCTFYTSSNECERLGYRPCLRCKPNELAPRSPIVLDLLDELRADPSFRWSEKQLRNRGYDPSTVRRHFEKELGLSFLKLARNTRVHEALHVNAKRGESAQLEASGYRSEAAFKLAIERMYGAASLTRQSASATREEACVDRISTPLGEMVSLATPKGCLLLEFVDRLGLEQEISAMAKRYIVVFNRIEMHRLIHEQLDEYFAGSRKKFTIPLVTSYGSPFQRSVWSALQDIPLGSTVSYKDVAVRIGSSNLSRPVGTAVAKNQLAILIPCHRVISSSGGLANYGGRIWRKQALLNFERGVTGYDRSSDRGVS
jgi:AraC family transcriptional regulator of adaptative response/methylated-DNA-[protein]-cysteine methyltransferase